MLWNEWLPVQLLVIYNCFTEPGQYVLTKQIINLNTNISMFTATPCSRETVKSHRQNTNAATSKKLLNQGCYLLGYVSALL